MNEYFLKLDNQIRKTYIEVIKGFFKWIILGFLMGIILGAVGTSFYYCIESATFFRENHSWIILLLPLAGAAIIYFYNAMGYPKDKGTNLVLLEVWVIPTNEELLIARVTLVLNSIIYVNIPAVFCNIIYVNYIVDCKNSIADTYRFIKLCRNFI